MTERFARDRMMHELKLRRISVLRTAEIAPSLLRITFTGDDLADFVSSAPGDHVKLLFPNPSNGVLTLPEAGTTGLRSSDIISRDYTPYEHRLGAAGRPELDIDFVLHGDNGPASAWAARAAIGSELGMAGPRGSLLPPTDIDAVVLVADESALPAAARWLDALSAPVTGLFAVADAATAAYLDGRTGEGRDLRWFSGDDRDTQLADALRTLTIEKGTFLFLAGEANALIPLRRYLRRELGLPKTQVEVHGYWKRGVVALDHHAPLDPADPEGE